MGRELAHAAREPGGRALSERRWPGFPRLWAAHSVSIFGDQLTLVALPLATYAATSSALAVGIVASAEAVTAVLFGLPAGAVADRLPYRRVLVLTDIGRLGILLALVIALRIDDVGLWPLLAAAIGLGIVRVVHDAAANAAVPLVVDDRDLVAANGRLQASEAASTAAGPALAGALIAAGGTTLAFGVDAATFALSGATLATLRSLDDTPPVDADDELRALARFRHDIADGARQLARDRVMRQIVGLVAAMNILAVAVEAQFIPYAREVLGIGALGIGAYFALGGSVAVVTSLLVARSSAALGVAITAGVAVFASGVAAAGLFPSFGTVALAYVGAGAGSAMVTTHAATFRQRRFPVRLQGRVSMAIRALILAPMPVGFVAGGWLAEHHGPETLFIVAGGIGLAAALAGTLAGTARLREG